MASNSTAVRTQELGCLAGALSNLWVGDKLGRRKTIITGGIIMIIGAILQTASVSYAMLVVARIVTGIGNGLNVSFLLSSCSVRQAFINCTRLRRSRPIMQNVQPLISEAHSS